MLKRINTRKGFASLVEIVVTSVIFLLAGVGIFTSIAMLRPHGGESSKKLEAGYIAKRVLDQLRSSVDASTWDDPDPASPLHPGLHTCSIGDFTVTYILINDAVLDVRQLFMNVTYN